MADSQPDFRLILRAEGNGPPAVVRLRRLLKCSLRAFGVRCVAVEEVPPEAAGEVSIRIENAARTPPGGAP